MMELKDLLLISPVIWAAIIGALGGIITAIITKGRIGSIVVGIIVGIIIGFGGGIYVPKVISGEKPIRTLKAPLDMTVYFHPSGWMGDGEGELGTRHIQLNTGFQDNPRPEDTDQASIQVSYQPGQRGWAGIYWQYPDRNWGDQPGTEIKGAKKIVFWARGEQGGERVEFKAGGIFASGKAYRDSFEVSKGRIPLTQDWRKYEIDLEGMDLSHVIGAFAWITNRDMNPQGLTFYLDGIRYES